MCTVSLIPTAGGFRLIANRDERRSRQAGLAPQARTLGSRRALFPVDAAAGGSWVGVNDRGLAVALLNRYTMAAHDACASCVDARKDTGRGSLITRGTLVPLLLACDDLRSALASAWTIDRRRFAPFRLVLAQGSCAAVITSEADRWSVQTRTLDGPLMVTSSALGDAHVDAPRRRLFARLLAAGGWSDGQRAFHRHQWSLRPDISVVMARSDARTVSRTSVETGRRGTTLVYEPLTEHPSRRASSEGAA